MLSKNKLKYIQSLKLKKFRQKYNKFTVEGDKMAKEILQTNPTLIESVLATPSWLKMNESKIRLLVNKTITISDRELKQISNLQTPNQVLIIADQIDYQFSIDQLATELSLYLDEIQDPGNLGTILRIADWFGIPNVILSKACAELYNPKVIQSTMGAFLRVNCFQLDLDTILAKLNTIPVYGTVLDGDDVFKSQLTQHGIIVVGNESKGISTRIQEQLTHRIAIPAGKNAGAESLNAAVATGIICALFKNIS